VCNSGSSVAACSRAPVNTACSTCCCCGDFVSGACAAVGGAARKRLGGGGRRLSFTTEPNIGCDVFIKQRASQPGRTTAKVHKCAPLPSSSTTLICRCGSGNYQQQQKQQQQRRRRHKEAGPGHFVSLLTFHRCSPKGVSPNRQAATNTSLRRDANALSAPSSSLSRQPEACKQQRCVKVRHA